MLVDKIETLWASFFFLLKILNSKLLLLSNRDVSVFEQDSSPEQVVCCFLKEVSFYIWRPFPILKDQLGASGLE